MAGARVWLRLSPFSSRRSHLRVRETDRQRPREGARGGVGAGGGGREAEEAGGGGAGEAGEARLRARRLCLYTVRSGGGGGWLPALTLHCSPSEQPAAQPGSPAFSPRSPRSVTCSPGLPRPTRPPSLSPDPPAAEAETRRAHSSPTSAPERRREQERRSSPRSPTLSRPLQESV